MEDPALLNQMAETMVGITGVITVSGREVTDQMEIMVGIMVDRQLREGDNLI
jgi:hypothetical protein